MIRNHKQIADYHVRPIPRMRRLVVDQAWLAQRKHLIRGLIEVDVTTARQTIRDHQAATGERLSFTWCRILNENRAGFSTRVSSRGRAKMCYHSSCSENDRGGALTSPSLGRLLISHITLQELTPML